MSYSVVKLGVAALTCEATRASTAPFDAANFDVRPHRGQIACADRLRLMLEGSKSVNSNKASAAVCVCFLSSARNSSFIV